MVKKGEKKDDKRYTSLYIKDEVIAEQCYDNRKVFFAVWDGVDVSYEDYIDDGIPIFPIEGEEIEKKAILLPTKAEEYGTDEELDNEIIEFIGKWLDIPPDVMQFALWNIKRSWVYDRFHTLNYLRALGDTGMGKSRFLDTLGAIHYKPINTSGATTAAPIFRIIEKWKGTLVMDEADLVKSDETQDIIKIINMGFEKGKYIMRCDKEQNNKINFFDPYCPKILATRKIFQDKAVESRCITQVMKGTSRKDIPLNLNKEFFEVTQTLRNKLLMWRFKNYYKIDPDKKIDLELDLEPRVLQIVNTFISMFGEDQKQLEVFKKFIMDHQEQLIEERKDSWEGSVVGAIHALVEEGNTDISSMDIIEKGSIRNKKGDLITPRGLTSTLKSLGFGKTTSKRLGEITKRCIPLNQDLLTNLFKRYGYGVTVVTAYMKVSENNNTEQIKDSRSNNNKRNNRNNETQNQKLGTINFKQNTLNSAQVKTTLISQFSMAPEIEIQQFLKIYPEEFHAAIDILIDGMKSEGVIYEPKSGFLRMLE